MTGLGASCSIHASSASWRTSTWSRPRLAHVADDRGDGLGRVVQVVRHVGDEVAALAELDQEGVREAVHVDAVHAAHAVGPVVREPCAVAAGQVEAEPADRLRADLEARGVDDAVDWVLNARHDHAAGRDPLDALAVGVDEMDRGRLNALRYSSWKHGRLQSWRYQALSRSAVSGSATIASTRARISLHLLVVGVSKSASRSSKLAVARARCRQLARGSAAPGRSSRP